MSAMLERLLCGRELSRHDAEQFFSVLTDAQTSPAVVGALLAALRAKGETATEIRALAEAMRAHARPCDLGPRDSFVDVVGTGGDCAGSFNLSTGAALLAAAAGARVVKHGGGAVSGRSGSADVLAALGLLLPLEVGDARTLLETTGFTFLHAPHFHEALRGLGSLRRSLGIRTVFNVVAPLCNPARPPYAVIGVSSLKTARAMAQATSGLSMARAFFIHGALGWDEPTPVGRFYLWDVRPGRVVECTRDPQELGMARCRADDLRGGDATANARALTNVFAGERGPHRDALVLGAALALEVSGRCRDMSEGAAMAARAFDDGSAARLLRTVATFRPETAGRSHA